MRKHDDALHVEDDRSRTAPAMIATLLTLLPAFIVIAAGAWAGRRFMSDEAVKGLSDLTFSLLLPALLFRSMATFQFQVEHARALMGYFLPTIVLLVAVTLYTVQRRHASYADAASFGLASSFSNSVQLGIPLTTLAFGQRGLGVLLSLIALQALVLLTVATLVTEFGQARQNATSLRTSLWPMIRAAVIHPVILPIVAGMLWSATGIALPQWMDSPLKFLADAASPLCLVLIGASLSRMRLREQASTALRFAAIKNVVHPIVVCATLYTIGIRDISLWVLTSVAALPTGTNAYLFAQRYNARIEPITAIIVVATLACAVTYTIVIALVRSL